MASPVASPFAPSVESTPERELTQPEFPVAVRPVSRRRPPGALRHVATVRGWPSDPALLSSVSVTDGGARPLAAGARPASPAVAPAVPSAPARVDARAPRLARVPSARSSRPVGPLPAPTRPVPAGVFVAAALVTGVFAYGIVQRLVTLVMG